MLIVSCTKNIMEEKNKKIILVIVLVLGLFALAIFSGYLLAKKGNRINRDKDEIVRLNEKFQQDKSAIVRMIEEGNNYPGAVDRIGQLLEEKQFTNLGQEANLKIMSAIINMHDPEETNSKKGIAIAKETANNVNYPSIWRAIALDYLADFVTVRGISFARENIFNDIYFSDMLKEGDLSLAQKRLYEKSLSLQETAIPNYKIASWYALQLLADKIKVKTLSKETKENYLQSAKISLKRGEDLFNEDYPKNIWNDSRLIRAYQSYAEVATKLYLLKEFNDSQKIIDSYDKAVAFYEKKYDIQKWPVTNDKIPVSTRILLPSLVYSYASSLAVMQKPVDQVKIQALLEILYDKNWNEKNAFNVFTFFNNNKKDIYKNKYSRFKIVSLAKVDNRFANLLTEMGWETEKAVSSLDKLPLSQFMAKD